MLAAPLNRADARAPQRPKLRRRQPATLRRMKELDALD
jgi:hypothetical protein